MKKARLWYEQKLGFTAQYVEEKEDRLVVFNTGGSGTLTIWELKGKEKLPTNSSACAFPIFAMKDAKKTHNLLKRRGVKVRAIEGSGNIRYFTFYDLGGNRLDACQFVK